MTSETEIPNSPEESLRSLPERDRASAVNHDINRINDFIMNTEDLAQDDPEYFREKLQRARALKDLMPILEASAEYIKKPEEGQHMDFLTSARAPLGILLQAFSVEHDIREQLIVDGLLAVAIINLLLNAYKYQDGEGPITANLSPDGLRIGNDSPEGLPNNLYEPGVKGSRGGDGLGLFIAQAYAKLRNRNISHDCQEHNGKFKVSATITL